MTVDGLIAFLTRCPREAPVEIALAGQAFAIVRIMPMRLIFDADAYTVMIEAETLSRESRGIE